jgi:hypothetical protein
MGKALSPTIAREMASRSAAEANPARSHQHTWLDAPVFYSETTSESPSRYPFVARLISTRRELTVVTVCRGLLHSPGGSVQRLHYGELSGWCKRALNE